MVLVEGDGGAIPGELDHGFERRELWVERVDERSSVTREDAVLELGGLVDLLPEWLELLVGLDDERLVFSLVVGAEVSELFVFGSVLVKDFLHEGRAVFVFGDFEAGEEFVGGCEESGGFGFGFVFFELRGGRGDVGESVGNAEERDKRDGDASDDSQRFG